MLQSRYMAQALYFHSTNALALCDLGELDTRVLAEGLEGRNQGNVFFTSLLLHFQI